MTKEQFLEKSKQLAVDFWTTNLHDGTYESHFRKLLDEYEETKQCNIANVSGSLRCENSVLLNALYDIMKWNDDLEDEWGDTGMRAISAINDYKAGRSNDH